MSFFMRRCVNQFSQNLFKYSRKREYKQINWISYRREWPTPFSTRNPVRDSIIFIAANLVGCGIFYVYRKRDVEKFLVENPQPTSTGPDDLKQYLLDNAPPKHVPARIIEKNADHTGLKLTLYQYQTCPFCCKVRAFLDYYGFSYNVIEVNSVTKKQNKWTDYKKVPFLIVEVEKTGIIYQLKDSSMIVSALHTMLTNQNMSFRDVLKSYPMTISEDEKGKEKSEIANRYFIMKGENQVSQSSNFASNERKWRQWVDNVFVHTLSPNVYRTPTEAIQAFTWFSQVGKWEELFGTWQKWLVIYVGSVAMYLIGKRLKKKYEIKDDVRESLYDEANIWTNAINANGTLFMGGNEPDLSDLNVYGVLTAIEGCDSFKDLIENTTINDWFNRMKSVVTQNGGSKLVTQRGIVE